MKKCIKCLFNKFFNEFYKMASSKDGHQPYCKSCHKLLIKQNPNKNQHVKPLCTEKLRIYKRNYMRQKRQTSIQYKLIHNLRRRLNHALKSQDKIGSYSKHLGCTVIELKLHLESKFQPGMTWENYGKWHIDHIIPLSSFDLCDSIQFSKACHYQNLQPLWAIDNRKKYNKIIFELLN